MILYAGGRAGFYGGVGVRWWAATGLVRVAGSGGRRRRLSSR